MCHNSRAAACEEGPGLFSHFLTGLALLMVAAMLPFSLFFVVKVVQVSFWSIEFQLIPRLFLEFEMAIFMWTFHPTQTLI